MTRSSSTRSGGQGPADVHATFGSTPKMPSRLISLGRTRRWDSRCSRRYASGVSLIGSASDAISVTTTTVRSPGRDRSPIAPSGSPNGLPLVASVGCGRLPSPSLPAGYQVSSTCPSAVVVAKPMPQAGDVETVTELPSFALSSQIGRLGHPGSAIPDRLSRIGHPGSAEAAAGPVSGQACGHSAVPALRKGTVRTMPNPLTPEVLADPVALTRALVDVESVSRNEKEIADYVIEALEKVPHLSVTRFGNTVMARTSLGRPRRVVLAGHLDTV